MNKDNTGNMDYGELLYRNVKQIAREQGRKLREIEQAIGVSTGYFARAKDARTPMTVGLALVLAKQLGVEIEDLITNRRQRKLQEALVREAISAARMFAGREISRETLIQMIREEPEVEEEESEDD